MTGPRFAVVGCRKCDQIWIVKNPQQSKTTECRRCQRTYQVQTLRVVETTESYGNACEAQVRHLARHADALDAYRENGHFAEQGELADNYLSRHDNLFADELSDYFATHSTDFSPESPQRSRMARVHPNQDIIDAWVEQPVTVSEPFSDFDWRQHHINAAESSAKNPELYRVLVDDRLDQFPSEADGCLEDEDDGTLTLTREDPENPTVTVTLDDRPPTEIWTQIANSCQFRIELIRAIRDTAEGLTYTEYYESLMNAGVEALAGRYATLCARVASGESNALNALFTETKRFGHGNRPLTGISKSALRLFALTDNVTPTIQINLTRTFCGTGRADDGTDQPSLKQRKIICRILEALADGCDVRVHASRIELRNFERHHRPYLPSVNKPWETHPSSLPLSERVEQAKDELSSESREVALLRTLATEDSEELSYNALYSKLTVGESRVRQLIDTLCHSNDEEEDDGLGLLERCGPQSERWVRLLPAGREFLDWLDSEIGRQQTLEESVNISTNSPTQNRIPRGSTGEGAETTASTTNASHSQGPHQVRRLAEWEAIAATVSAPENGIGIIDYPIAKQRNPRSPRWQYDRTDDRLVVGAETTGSHSAMKMWVCLARALAGGWTWQNVLGDGDRLDTNEKFSTLLTEFKETLRGSYGLGFLPDEVTSGAEYKEKILTAERTLCDLSRDYSHRNFDCEEAEFRGKITKFAKGLATTMKFVLELVGVDVVVEFRAPTYNQTFDDHHRDEFVTTVANAVAVWSRYKHSNAYKQLFETDSDNREMAIEASVDDAHPSGSLTGSITVVGDFRGKLEDFTTTLCKMLSEPHDLHDDAPEFTISVPLRTNQEIDRDVFVATVERMCRARNLRPSREAVSLYRLFTATPYDVAAAISALETEETRREIRLDEVRYGLGRASEARVMPWTSGKTPTIVSALLVAEKPLSVSAVADRADVVPTTVRNNCERLTALDLVRETDEGLRLALPFHNNDERNSDIRPWYARPDSERDDLREASVGGVVLDLFDELAPPDDVQSQLASALASLPDYELLQEVWPWIESWLAALRVVVPEDEYCQPETSDTGPVVFGNKPQQSIWEALTEK